MPPNCCSKLLTHNVRAVLSGAPQKKGRTVAEMASDSIMWADRLSMPPPAALDGHQALRFGLVDQREYNWDGRGRALERGRRHRAGTDITSGANATTLRDYLLNDIRRDMDRRVSKFASGKMSILSIKFAVSSRGFPDPCNQFPVRLRREFNSKPLNFLIDWTSKSPKEA